MIWPAYATYSLLKADYGSFLCFASSEAFPDFVHLPLCSTWSDSVNFAQTHNDRYRGAAAYPSESLGSPRLACSGSCGSERQLLPEPCQSCGHRSDAMKLHRLQEELHQFDRSGGAKHDL